MKSKLALALVCFSLLIIGTGCVDKDKINKSLETSSVTTESTATAETNSSGNTVLVSSMLALPLMLELTQGLPYEATCVGNEASIEAIQQKTAELALCDGINEDSSVMQDVIAFAGVAIVVSKTSPLEGVSAEEVRGFFSGETDQIQGYTFERVITAPSTPGRSIFETYFQLSDDSNGMMTSLIPDSAMIVESDVQVIEVVGKNPSAIGIVLIGALNDQVKALPLDSIPADVKHILDGTYPVQTPIVLVSDLEHESDFKGFLDQSKSDKGQQAILKAGFIAPLN